MELFAAAFIALVASFVITAVFGPKPPDAKPGAFDESSLPQVEEGTPQCVAFGDVWTKDWMVLGVTNYRTSKIKKKTGMFGKKTTVGHWYYLTMLMGISRGPVDELLEIKVSDRTAWSGSVSESGTFRIRNKNLFGGEDREGGIEGYVIVMMGDDDQVAHNDVKVRFGPDVPGYRRMFTAFYDGAISANTPYPKPWSFRFRRTESGWEGGSPWYPEKLTIWLDDGKIKAMNPAHIIYETITNREWGRGLHPMFIDEASFRDCADTLYDEGFGLCLRWSRKDTFRAFTQNVIDHIGGVLITNRETGLIQLKLIRNDYVPNMLPLYTTENGLLEVRESTVSTITGAVNQVTVRYRDPITNEERSVSTYSLAALQITQGAFNGVTKEFVGLPTAELALRVAQRELRVAAYPVRRFKLVFDRRAWRINPGDVFRIQNPARGLADIIVRVGRVEDGTLTDGKIVVTAVQDIFSFPLNSFTNVQKPSWTPPDVKPEIKRHEVFEMPYVLLARDMSPADMAYLPADAAYIGVVAEKPTALSVGYNLAVRDGPPDPEDYPTES